MLRSLSFLVLSTLCTAVWGVAVGNPAPDIGSQRTLNTDDGKGVTVKQFRGRVVLIDFWATWCGPCVASIPHVEKLHQKYGDKGLVVIGHTDASSQGLEKMIKEKGMSYIVSVGTNIGDAYGVKGIPAVFLIDARGKIAWNGHPSSLNDSTIETLLKDVDPMAMNGALPQFTEEQLSSVRDVRKAQIDIMKGDVGDGLEELEELIEDKEHVEEAQKSLEIVHAWRKMVDGKLADCDKKGDAYQAYEMNVFMANALRGHDDADAYKDRAKAIKKSDAYDAGKDFQKFAALSADMYSNKGFIKAAEKFIEEYESGYYVDEVKKMIKQ